MKLMEKCEFNKREQLCVFTLTNSMYVIDGSEENSLLDSRSQYDTKTQNIKVILRMNAARFVAACTVYYDFSF